MLYSESNALKILSGIKDPRTSRDIVSAGKLTDLIYKNGVLQVILSIEPALVEGFEPVRKLIEESLSIIDGVDKVLVLLTSHKASPQIKKVEKKPAQSNPHKPRRPQGYQGDSEIKSVIAISSAKGGVGKSTVAVNLAIALAKQDKKVGLLDADIHGPSIPIIMGMRGIRASTVEVEGRRLIKPNHQYNIKVMSIGFLTDNEGPIIWRGPMVQGAVSKMLWDVNWGKLDFLIIDMPPGTGDVQIGLSQDIKPNGAVIVSTPQDLALADARKGEEMFRKVKIPILGIVENMASFSCPDCGSVHYIFGKNGARDEAIKMKIPYLGSVPLEIGIRESGDKGTPIAHYNETGSKVFSKIAKNTTKELNSL
jgi:ATP-binding protein involved in chromosome partitioning